MQPKMHRAVPAVRCATAPPVLWRGSCGPSQGQLLSGGEYASIIPEVGRGGETVVDAQTGRTGATAAGRFANAHGITEGASLGAVSRVCKADDASRLSAVEAGAPAAAAQTKAETDDDQRVVTSGLAAVASTMPEDAAAAAGGGGNTPARGETGRIHSVGVIIDLTEDDDALAGASALPVVHTDLACSKVSQVGARRVRAEGESADGDDAARSPAKRACGAAVAPPGGTGAVGETGEGVAKAKAEAEAEPTGGGPRLTELLPAEADSQDARAVMVRNTRTHAHAHTRTHLRTHAYARARMHVRAIFCTRVHDYFLARMAHFFYFVCACVLLDHVFVRQQFLLVCTSILVRVRVGKVTESANVRRACLLATTANLYM